MGGTGYVTIPPMPPLPPIPPILRLVAGASMISFSPVLVKVAHVGPTISGFYRVLIGGVVLVTIAAARRRGFPPRGHLLLAGFTGVLVAVDLALWHRAVHYIGPGLATILGNLQVFFMAAFGVVILGERLTRRMVLAIPIAIVGLVLVFGVEGDLTVTTYRLGVLFGMLTAIFYAAYLLALRRTTTKFPTTDATTTVAVLTVVAVVVLGVLGLVEHESFAIPDRGTLAALVALGIGPQVVGWVLISGALPHVEVGRAGLLLLLQPSLAFVWDVVLLNRPLRGIEVMGAVITIAAIYMGMRGGDGTEVQSA